MRRFVRRSDLGIIIGCIFVFVVFSLWNPQQWFNWGTVSNIGQYTAVLGFLAIGQTFVILIREIDLSVGSVYRSEEHTSELQSLRHLVCRLLLEKKKTY